MRKIGNFTVRTIDYIFVFLISVILLASLVSFSEWISNGWIKYGVFIFSIIIVACFIVFGEIIFKKLYFFRDVICDFSAVKLGILLFAIVLLTKVFFVFLFDNDANIHPDMKMYLSYATQFANKGEITENTFYASRFKYTVVYGLFLSPIIKLFGSNSKPLLIYLSVLFAVLSILLFDTIRVYVGKEKAFIGILLFNILPVGLFETQLLIHETPLLFFYILSFWLLTKFLKTDYNIVLRIFALVLSAILISFGNKINQGGTIVIVSYCIYLFVMLCKDKISWKRFLESTVAVICFVLCFFMISSLCTSYVKSIVKPSESDRIKIERSEKNSVHFGWGWYLGSNIEKAGIWNEEDSLTYHRYIDIADVDEAKEYQYNLIDERLQVFKDNPQMIPGHLFNKIKGLWGNPQLPFAYDMGNSVNHYILTGAHGIIYKGILGLSYWVFILLCSLILFSHKRHKNINIDSFYTPVTLFKMMIIGLTAVLFLFEVTSKYVSHMQIIMFSIGLFSFSSFMDNSSRINEKLKRKQFIKG